MLKTRLYEQTLAHLEPLREQWPNAAELSPDAWRELLEKQLKIERPRHAEHGDYAVNLSFLAKYARLAPPKIVEQVLPHFKGQPDYEVEGVAGFINFKLTPSALLGRLLHRVREAKVGENQSLAETRLLLEYVSANPTGPLHLGHGRWAALGDSIRRLYEHCGAQVCSEFYVNDFGQQMLNMANSLWFRSLELIGKGSWPEPVEGEPFPYYPGNYVIDLANQFLGEPEQKAWIEAKVAEFGPVRLDRVAAEPLLLYSRDTMIVLQQKLLDRFRTRFDVWTLESTLHQSGLVEAILDKLKATGYTESKEGALWIKSSEFGDEKDRVLVKSDGSYTYLTADIAYHDEKFTRKPSEGHLGDFNRLVNIWGADHHGYVARMNAALKALKHPVEEFDILLGQLVNLIIDGEKARMGKRSKMLTLEEIIDEVGVDATRFWLVSRSADNTIEFDLNLAGSNSEENPVYYTQYAHARACSLLRTAFQSSADPTTGEEKNAPLSEADFYKAVDSYELSQLVEELWTPLASDDRAQKAVREMILLLESFEEQVASAARLMAPHLVARYVLDLSSQFHSFYAACRVLTSDPKQSQARLLLILAIRKTMAQALDLLGVSAPDSM